MVRVKGDRSHSLHDNNASKRMRRRNHDLNIDPLDTKIIRELVEYPDIQITTLAKKLGGSLSTIQRRKGDLEKESILKRKYELSVQGLGWRNAEILMFVDNGEADKMAQELLEKFDKVIGTAVMINTKYNLIAYVGFKTTNELHELMESVRRIPNVKNIEWFEVVRMVGNKNQRLVNLAFNSSRTNRTQRNEHV